jgi:DNA-binding transcriptional ArsR family regulator
MSLPTVGEHLKALELAELVEREQTERKWKYYSLTGKARMLLHPNTTTIWFVLGLFLFSAVATVINAVKYFSPVTQFAAPAAKMMAAEEAVADAALAQEAMALSAPVAAQASPVWLIVFGLATVVMLVILLVLLRRHGWLGSSLSNKKNI